jgi:hypothetical protein
VDWRWLNLWRDTDPVGGWHFTPSPPGEPPAAGNAPSDRDRRLRDPQSISAQRPGAGPAPIEGHWPYYHNPEYQAAVHALATAVTRLPS